MSFNNHDSDDSNGKRYSQQKKHNKLSSDFGKKERVFKNPILKELRHFCADNCDKFGNLNMLEVIDKINSIEDRLNDSVE